MNTTTTEPRFACEMDAYKIPLLHLINGNDKLGRGIYQYSLMPGAGVYRMKDGRPLAGSAEKPAHGTCAGCCNGCFSECYFRRSLRFEGCAVDAAQNTVLVTERPERVYISLANCAKRHSRSIKAIRFHTGGEFPPGDAGFEELLQLAEFARDYPRILVYGYTKRSELLARYRDTVGEMPANLVIMVSMWNDTVTNHTGAPEFHYDDGSRPDVAAMPHCKAVGPDGKPTGVKCSECRYCMDAKPGDKFAVYAH